MPWRLVKAAQLRANEIKEIYYLGNNKCNTCYKYKDYIRSYLLDTYCTTVVSDIQLEQGSTDVITDSTTLSCNITIEEVGEGIDSRFENSGCSLTITEL